MKKSKKKILITGALGHIGSRLIREISPKITEEIHMLDNLLTQRYASLFDLPKNFKYRFFEEDILTAPLEERLKDVSAVIHLAAITNAEASVGKEKEVEMVNFEGLKRVANACLEAKVPLLFPSSTSVYGSQSKLVDETCDELIPQSPYAESKLFAEKYLLSLKEKGLRFIVCRFGTIFGWSVGMRFHTAVNKFTWQAINRKPITVWKTAWKQRRPYLDLSDCVKTINFSLEKNLFDGEIYNVVTKNYTVEEIIETIRKFIPNLEITYVDSTIMNRLSYDVDGSKLKSKGLKFGGDLAESIKQTIDLLKGIKI